MKDFDYQHWLATAAGRSRRRSEAADLLHDALLDAIRADRTDFGQAENRRWFAGVLRNRAAMAARTAARRRRRERAVTPAVSRDRPTPPSTGFIQSLPAAARRVATLAVAGMTKPEILAALRITDTSFRQRLTTIRRAWLKLDHPSADSDASAGSTELDLGLIRRALLRHVRSLGGVGTHDPDGHLIVLESPLNSTSQARAPRQRNGTRPKG